MPTQDFVENQRRVAADAAALAREVAREDALAELMADPRLLQLADAAEGEIAKLQAEHQRAETALAEIDELMTRATVAGDEAKIAKLESSHHARMRIRDYARGQYEAACESHELVRVAARRFRERAALETEYPALEGRGRNVEEATACLMAQISSFRHELVAGVLCLADAIHEHNVAGADFDRRAESAKCNKRVGKVSIERVLADVVTALRDRDWQFTGRPLQIALNVQTANQATLTFSFSEPTGIQPWQL